MKASSVIASLLFVGGSLAARGTAARRARNAAKLAKRSGNTRNSNPRFPAIGSVSNETNVEYSSNWAGAVLIGTGYNSVTATINVPKASVPSGESEQGEYYASAWVGIDGDTCDTAILQTGFDIGIENGQAVYDAWYEWYPDYAYDFDDFDVTEGDSIKVTVKATSTSSGTATLENLTTGKTATHTFTNENDGELCEYNAEWIVEDFESGDSLVEFADFDEFTFTDCSAGTTSGETVGVSDATIIDIEQNGQVLTSVTIESSSEIVVTYQ